MGATVFPEIRWILVISPVFLTMRKSGVRPVQPSAPRRFGCQLDDLGDVKMVASGETNEPFLQVREAVQSRGQMI